MPICFECGGTGQTSSGGVCRACKGSGQRPKLAR